VRFRDQDGHGLRASWYPSPKHEPLSADEMEEYELGVVPRAIGLLAQRLDTPARPSWLLLRGRAHWLP
jgi:hypothetical protein